MHNRKDPSQRLTRWMYKFSNYEYTFEYKPGKFNVCADALCRNPVIHIGEEEINQKLPELKVMVLQKISSSKQEPKRPRPRAATVSSAEPFKIKNPGRPLGSKTSKIAPKLDHSIIAQRTRSKTTTE